MAAATLISWANSFGDRRRAAKASSGTSIVTVAILLLLFLGNLAQSSRHQMDQGQASFTDYTCFRPAQTVRCSCPVSRERKREMSGKGTSLNSTCLTPEPLASSVYVHVPGSEIGNSATRQIETAQSCHGLYAGQTS